jgi:hypothetical protein
MGPLWFQTVSHAFAFNQTCALGCFGATPHAVAECPHASTVCLAVGRHRSQSGQVTGVTEAVALTRRFGGAHIRDCIFFMAAKPMHVNVCVFPHDRQPISFLLASEFEGVGCVATLHFPAGADVTDDVQLQLEGAASPRITQLYETIWPALRCKAITTA